MSIFYCAYFVKQPQPDAPLRQRFGKNIHCFPDTAWLTCGFGSSTPDGTFEEGAYFTTELSAQFAEVIFLCADSRNDQLEYEHSRNGAVLRKLSLIYDGCQSTWEWVEGKTEAWEECSIFSAANFARAQELLSYEDLPYRAKENELRQLWEQREYLLHDKWPPTDATLEGVIREHFGLKLPR